MAKILSDVSLLSAIFICIIYI